MAHKRKKPKGRQFNPWSIHYPDLGHLAPLHIVEGKLQHSSTLLDGNLTQNQQWVPRFQQASQEESTPQQHSGESREMN